MASVTDAESAILSLPGIPPTATAALLRIYQYMLARESVRLDLVLHEGGVRDLTESRKVRT